MPRSSSPRSGTSSHSSRFGAESTTPVSTFVIPGAPAVRCSTFRSGVPLCRHAVFNPSTMRRQTPSGVFCLSPSSTEDCVITLPPRSASSIRTRVPPISAAATYPCRTLKRSSPGGRPPLDSPSPICSTNPSSSRCAMPLDTVGALNPEYRTRSAFEHGLCSCNNCNNPRAFVCRNCEGRDGIVLVASDDGKGKVLGMSRSATAPGGRFVLNTNPSIAGTFTKSRTAWYPLATLRLLIVTSAQSTAILSIATQSISTESRS